MSIPIIASLPLIAAVFGLWLALETVGRRWMDRREDQAKHKAAGE